MKRVPFGIERLDATIGGCPPAGSVVLVAGAGAREFCYTSAVLCGLAHEDGDPFELHYGALAPEANLPEAIHYCSFTADREELCREIGLVIDEEISTTGLDGVSFHDLSGVLRLEPGARRVVRRPDWRHRIPGGGPQPRGRADDAGRRTGCLCAG